MSAFTQLQSYIKGLDQGSACQILSAWIQCISMLQISIPFINTVASLCNTIASPFTFTFPLQAACILSHGSGQALSQQVLLRRDMLGRKLWWTWPPTLLSTFPPHGIPGNPMRRVGLLSFVAFYFHPHSLGLFSPLRGNLLIQLFTLVFGL